MTILEFTNNRPGDMVFGVGGKETLRLTPEGFVYKGKIIEDAGEAYKLFMEWQSKASILSAESGRGEV